MKNYRTLTLQQLLKWAEDNRDIMRLRTDRDVLPGGYMAAFAPVLVAWQESKLRDSDSHVVLRNVNYGGNPVERTTVLQSARVPLDGIEAAEFILVPLNPSGTAHHAELRFIFAPQRSPELLNLAGSQTGTVASFPDLIFSWEAWRPPQSKFSIKEGLDESAYGLTLRAFAGPQLFLEDSLRQHDWFSYRLRLPGGKAGLQELLKVVLALALHFLAGRNIPEYHHRSANTIAFNDRCRGVFHRHTAAICAPEDLVIHLVHLAIPDGAVDRTLLPGVGRPIGVRMMMDVM